MSRTDLLALSADDLVTLSNRGIVRRAQQEVETLTAACTEDADGNVAVHWDGEGVDCTIPAKGGLPAAVCTCPATTVCRHIIRSVFAYQRLHIPPTVSIPESLPAAGHLASGFIPEDSSAERESPSSPDVGKTISPAAHDFSRGSDFESPSPFQGEGWGEVALNSPPEVSSAVGADAPGIWDPGTIDDGMLATGMTRATLAKARRLFEDGQVVELVRSSKPTARLHSLSANVRFLVPGDIRYTYCDCAETQPCTHVAVAVWAFRLLAPECHGGVVSTHIEALSIPVDVLDDADDAVRDVLVSGFANLSLSEIVRWRRLEARLRIAGLVWPAEIAADLVAMHEAYAAGDARFVPVRLPELAGELLVRSDAIRNDTGVVPQLFIRGSASDRITEIGSARLVGLGCGVRVKRRAVQLSAYLQDIDSGMTVAVTRLRSDPAPGSPDPVRTFADLAVAPVIKGSNLHNLGFGQLLVKGGKRTASGEFLPGRSPFAYSPQSYRWESLRPPLYAEDFEELRARIEAQPPASLRPRRVAGSLSVCGVASVAAVRFDAAAQLLEATVTDRSGHLALVTFPYYARCAGGFDRLASALRDKTRTPRFMSGQFHVSPAGLTVEPVAIVFEKDGVREMVQPWVDAQAPTASAADRSAAVLTPPPASLAAAILDDVLEALADLYLVGLTRLDASTARTWTDLASHAAATGFTRLSVPLSNVARLAAARSSTLSWTPASIAPAVADLTAIVRIAIDLL